MSMKLSRRARYALRMMLAISRYEREEQHVSLTHVAETTNISRRYMEQIAIALKSAGLIMGVPGKDGGYNLARPPVEIRLREIVEAVVGVIEIVECVDKPELCMQSTDCECRDLYRLINDRITQILDDYSLADLARGKPGVAL